MRSVTALVVHVPWRLLATPGPHYLAGSVPRAGEIDITRAVAAHSGSLESSLVLLGQLVDAHDNDGVGRDEAAAAKAEYWVVIDAATATSQALPTIRSATAGRDGRSVACTLVVHKSDGAQPQRPPRGRPHRHQVGTVNPTLSKLARASLAASVVATRLQQSRSAWAGAIDTALGIAAGLWLARHATQAADAVLNAVLRYTVHDAHIYIVWLMGAPGGLKLNGALSAFLATVFSQYLSWWSALVAATAPLLPSVVWAVAASGVCGLSVLLSSGADVIRAATLHLMLVSGLAMRLFVWTSHYLASTWRHFIGKKWNVLRHRVDSCELGIDQLLLNSVIFTTLLFLWPTITVYHAFFALYRGAVIVATATIQLCAGCLVCLSLPPGQPISTSGVTVLPRPAAARQQPADTYVLVETKPNRLLTFAKPYRALVRQLAEYYSPWRLCVSLVAGRPLPLLPLSALRWPC